MGHVWLENRILSLFGHITSDTSQLKETLNNKWRLQKKQGKLQKNIEAPLLLLKLTVK